jgi:uncharacterized protein
MKIIHYPSQKYLPIKIIAENAFTARSFWQRFVGLMLRGAFEPMDAMIFSACRAIHTHFMRFPIDVVCLNSEKSVCDIADTINPGRIFVPRESPSCLIELPAGTIREYGIRTGDTIELDK